MRSPQLWAIILTLTLALLSAWSLISIEWNSENLADPSDYASDRFDVWEQTTVTPVGLLFTDSLESAALMTFQIQGHPEWTVWHSFQMPVDLPEGWSSESWRGGWILGRPEALAGWEENPGGMASKWHPRSDGLVRLEQKPKGHFRSNFSAHISQTLSSETTWISDSIAMSLAPLAQEWLTAWNVVQTGEHGLASCRMARWGTPNGLPPDSSLLSIWNGTWATLEWESGETLEIWGWSDSTGFKSNNGGEVHADGWYHWKENRKPASWLQFDRLLRTSDPSQSTWDAVSWTADQIRLGTVKDNRRVAWIVKGEAKKTPSLALQSAEEMPSKASPLTGPLAMVRNHRLNQEMAIHWEKPSVIATSGRQEVWRKELSGDDTPQAWEVDLYRNGKYQVALANSEAFHVIDVLGREVKGYPLTPASGISAAAVIDYDRNRNYRILIGTSDGGLLNYREEGNRTPGWSFTPQPGRVIVQVHHLRVGNRDYLYAGQDDGSIRLLKRSGADRFQSPVSVPSDQAPCFRLSESIASSTVLYIDEKGWTQERTFGTDEAVGMTRMTQGFSISLEDRDGDGIQEVIVQTSEGEEVWNARNERISP